MAKGLIYESDKLSTCKDRRKREKIEGQVLYVFNEFEKLLRGDDAEARKAMTGTMWAVFLAHALAFARTRCNVIFDRVRDKDLTEWLEKWTAPVKLEDLQAFKVTAWDALKSTASSSGLSVCDELAVIDGGEGGWACKVRVATQHGDICGTSRSTSSSSDTYQ